MAIEFRPEIISRAHSRKHSNGVAHVDRRTFLVQKQRNKEEWRNEQKDYPERVYSRIYDAKRR